MNTLAQTAALVGFKKQFSCILTPIYEKIGSMERDAADNDSRDSFEMMEHQQNLHMTQTRPNQETRPTVIECT